MGRINLDLAKKRKLSQSAINELKKLYKKQEEIFSKMSATDDPRTLRSLAQENTQENLDNEIEVLKSYRLLEQVCKSLNLNNQYYNVGYLNNVEIWKNRPFCKFLSCTPVDDVLEI